MFSSVAASHIDNNAWTIVFDDCCPIVQKLGWLVRQWDSKGIFKFVGRDSTEHLHRPLVQMLDASPWSLLLLDESGNAWSGPEAIPFILKNLPSGRLAAVAYTLPGTMWLTRQLYMLVSRNRHMFDRSLPRLQPAGPHGQDATK